MSHDDFFATQTRMLSFYTRQYNLTTQRIDYLYRNLEQINNNINNVYNQRLQFQNLNSNLNLNLNINLEETAPSVLTREQILQSTANTRYSNLIYPSSTTCPISLEIFNDGDYVTEIFYCGHIFKTIHLNTWFQQSSNCPVCRYDIRNSYTNTNTNTNTNIINNANNPGENIIRQLLRERNINENNYSVDLSNNIFLTETGRNNLFNIFQNNYL